MSVGALLNLLCSPEGGKMLLETDLNPSKSFVVNGFRLEE